MEKEPKLSSSDRWISPRDFWSGKRVLVTGGSGFLGRRVVAELEQRGAADIIVVRSREHDLTDPHTSKKLLLSAKPQVVIHLAAYVGGIEANRRQPADFFHGNLMLGAPLVHNCYQAGVEKFVGIGTVCSYPKYCPVPFQESSLWEGYPEETNAPYGLAKRALLTAAQTYREQYGFDAITLLPVNLYGPEDNLDPVKSHVIPSLIRKCVVAKEEGATQMTAWGTGTASREFLYVDDAAEGVLMAAERYSGPAPINLGSGQEISISALLATIARLVGFEGEIVWDASRPDGQPRRCLDVSKAEREFGFRARTNLETGLRETISWFLDAARPEASP